MRLALRADASQALGAGHVMRCLSLANQLRQRGADTVFVCLELPEHLESWLKQAGHQVQRLPASARADELADAQATLALVGAVDVMVLDHYGLGLEWERAVGRQFPLLALDDVGRAHEVRWLLDQNYYADPQARYSGRLWGKTTVLFGPEYALLRPEFAAARRQARLRDQGVRHLLVFLGGMDADNVTGVALEAIDRGLPADVRVSVVAGASHPALPELTSWCEARTSAQLHVQVSDMASFMLDADLAIGAGGSSTWERCAAGLPTVTLCLAENQRAVIQEGARAGFLWGMSHVPSPQVLGDVLLALYHAPEMLAGMSARALAVTDARGAERVADVLMPRSVQVRPASLDDARMIYDWRTSPGVQGVSRSREVFSFEAHCDWLARTLADPTRLLLIGTAGGADIGVVRFDVKEERTEVSIFLAPERKGGGWGGALLSAAEERLRESHPEVRWIDAWINEGNQASTQMFNRLGYQARICRLDKEIA